VSVGDATAVEDVGPEVSSSVEQGEPEEDERSKPMPDRLLTELTAYRTLALRDAVAQNPDLAFVAALHVLCLKLFYGHSSESCFEIDVKSVVFGSLAPGLGDTAIAKAIDDRHRQWSEQLPREPADLWDTLLAFDLASRHALFAHCVGLSINAVHDSWNRRARALSCADRVAETVDFDIAAAGWSPTVDNYLGRVTKARILQAVREARGEQAAQLVASLKKGEMAQRAEELLLGSGWLPEPLRTPGRTIIATALKPHTSTIAPSEAPGEESAFGGYERAMAEPRCSAEDGPAAAEPHAVAAE
jgi:ParB family chromosome partitioning protein